MRKPQPGAENFIVLVMLAIGVTIVMIAVALAGDDLPVKPPRFEPKTGYKGPGIPGPEIPPAEDEEDPRDTPPPVFFGEEIEDTDTLVYVLDRSSSMHSGTTGLDVRTVQAPDGSTRMVDWALPGTPRSGGGWKAASRWQRAAVETINSVSALADNIRFDVIVYDCLSRWCFGKPEPATPSNKALARAWILANGPGGAFGGTDTGPATALGVGMPDVDKVILLTDGVPECMDRGTNAEVQARHRRVIRVANRRRVPIHVFGIGVTDIPRAFCQGVAADNQGTYTEVR